MQSMHQYRRFGAHIERQYERDREKAAAGRITGGGDDGQSPQAIVRSGSSSSPSSSSPSSSFASATSDRELNFHDTSKPSNILTAAHCNVPPNATSHPPDSRELSDPEKGSLTIGPLTTQRSQGTALGETLTGIAVRSRTTHEGGKGDRVFVVGYEGEDDVLNPHNWSYATRVGATVIIAAIGWIVGFASSVDSAALVQASQDFGVSEVTESLATGLFLIGFGVGALFAGPISETVGRNPVYIATLSLYMVFVMASALAPNIGAQLAFRFIAGCFASTPLTCAGGSLSDLWSPMERVWAFPVFANAAFMGPIFGPVVGGFVGQSRLVSWRWTEWITLIISGLVLAMVIFFQPETYAPVLLSWKAKKLRELTGDERYKAGVEIRDVGLGKRLTHALYRPFMLTLREPIIMLVALYLSVIYIILFTFLNGYTFIFTETYGFSQGITGLSFIGIGIGLCLASALVPLIYSWAKKDLATIQEQGGSRLPPEFRLWFAMLGAPFITISILWMAWTTRPSISYWSPLVASVVFGYGILCVFISCYQYIIDGYETYAASALASVTLIRYVVAGGMVEVAVSTPSRCVLFANAIADTIL